MSRFDPKPEKPEINPKNVKYHMKQKAKRDSYQEYYDEMLKAGLYDASNEDMIYKDWQRGLLHLGPSIEGTKDSERARVDPMVPVPKGYCDQSFAGTWFYLTHHVFTEEYK